MVFTEHLADHAGTFFIRLAVLEIKLLHGEQDAPVHRFEPIAHVGKGTSDDNAHGVIQVSILYLFLNVYRDDFFVSRVHNLRILSFAPPAAVSTAGLLYLIRRESRGFLGEGIKRPGF
jgi:hypothetical protein